MEHAARLGALCANLTLWAGLAGYVDLRRLVRVSTALLRVTKRHLPWIVPLLIVCQFIVGPFDEILALVVIGIVVAFKPKMRADMVSSVRAAWN